MSEVKNLPPPSSISTWGLTAEFEKPEALLNACAAVRDSGIKRWDAHSPYPVHGLDQAMGIRPTVLPWLVFGAGVTGAFVGIGMQWYTNAFDYKFMISGKPYFSVPANIPVMFEVTILFAAIAAVVGMLALNNLPLWYHALFTRPRFRRATSDRFFISIEAGDEKFDRASLEELLRKHGATTVELVEE